MADYLPVNGIDRGTTYTASAAVVGGRLVESTGSLTVGPAGAGSTKTLGVPGFDAAAGARVTVHPRRGVHDLVTSAAVTAGNTLQAGANGTVVPWVSGTDAANLIVGTATSTAASGALVRVDGA